MSEEYSQKIPSYCKCALKVLNDNGFEAYVVGGAVRDLVMGRDPHDFDIATSANPDEIISVMSSAGYQTIDMARKHGTITAIIMKANVEITSYRTEGTYNDNRHPDSVTFTRSIEEDVKRRDFTMNALYLDKDGCVVDLNSGIDDINHGIVRAVGDAKQRFDEDALRIMRGLRFASELGFNVEEATAKAMINCCLNLKNISGERIYTEFTKLITAPNATSVIRDYVDVLAVFLPSLSKVKGFEQHSKYHNLDVLEHTLSVLDGIPLINDRRDVELSYAALMHDIGKPEVFKMDEKGHGHMKGHAEVSVHKWEELCKLLKPSSKVQDTVVDLIRYHDTYPEASKKSVHKFMTQHSEEFLNKLHILQRADVLAHNETAVPRYDLLNSIVEIEGEIRASKAPLSRSDLAISGSELIALGITPGVGMGRVIDQLLEGVISGSVQNNKEDLIKYAQKLSIDNIN